MVPSIMPTATIPPQTDQPIKLPITPPTTDSDPQSEQILYTASHVLSIEATALSHLSRLYATDPVARDGFVNAVDGIRNSIVVHGGKLVVVGVGKSGKVGEKFVATMNSLGLLAVFMHPVEALHGDLGLVRVNDIILMITYSGNTPELLALLPHIPAHIPRIVLTSHTSYNTTKLTSSRSNTILLPAPIPQREEATFGVPAPTSSTTVAMALSDALAMAVSRVVHGDTPGGPREVFRKNHPGGAIGLNMGKIGVTLLDMAVSLGDIPIIAEEDEEDETGGGASRPQTPSSGGGSSNSSTSSDSESDIWTPPSSSRSRAQVRVLDCLLLAVRAPGGWLRTAKGEVIPPRRLQGARDPEMDFRSMELGLVVPGKEWIRVPGDASVDDARKWVMTAREEVVEECDGLGPRVESLVVGAVVGGKVVGVVEYGCLCNGR